MVFDLTDGLGQVVRARLFIGPVWKTA